MPLVKEICVEKIDSPIGDENEENLRGSADKGGVEKIDSPIGDENVAGLRGRPATLGRENRFPDRGREHSGYGYKTTPAV